MNLAGKVAIVTGGGHGAGAAVAQALAQAGARVCISDLNPDRAMKVEQAIITSGGEAMSVPADVANKFQCVTVIESTREKWGQLDILINAMAVAPKRTIIKIDEWDFQRALEVNLKGTFFMSQLCGRVMADENGERGGAIINLATTAGITEPLAGHAAACTANGAIVGFAAECAREYAEYGLRVNTVLLNAIDPQPEQAAQNTMWLLSKDGGSLNGKLLAPDGSTLKWSSS
ncbi:MAG: SDR family oxidoreductase [Chloroflexota bacterium]